jgi:hypothetical protein
MHMPKQVWSTPVSHLSREEQRRLMRESFDRHFPWLAAVRVSEEVAKDTSPDQRGFLIGGTRL